MLENYLTVNEQLESINKSFAKKNHLRAI